VSNEKQQSFVVENGITLGVIVLALFIIFAVGLPRWFDGDGAKAATAHSSITLPKKLSGGLKINTSKDIAGVMAKQQKDAADALGTSTALAVYGSSSDQYIVQAVRDSGGALLPTAQGSYTTVGDSVCLTDAIASQAYGVVTCRHSSAELTVQVTGVSDKKAAKYADEIFKKLS